MISFLNPSIRRLLSLGILPLFLLAMSGCVNLNPPGGTSAFPSPGAHWNTLVGQLRYVNPQRAVIGEAVVSHWRSDKTSEFQLDFVTGPGVPLIRVRESGETAYAEGIFARGHWRGTAAKAGRLAPWMTLRDAFAAATAKGSKGGAIASSPGAATPWKGNAEFAKGNLQRLTVEFPKTKERFIFVFTP